MEQWVYAGNLGRLANAKVDVVLSAHDHDYERLSPLNAEDKSIVCKAYAVSW